MRNIVKTPYHPQQNPFEKPIQDIKARAQTFMDRTGDDSKAWFQAMEYYYYLCNRKSHREKIGKHPWK